VLDRDGVAVRIRDALPADEPEIEELLQTLSARSVYQRFLSVSPRSAQAYAERLDDRSRTLDAVVAAVGGQLVAVGSTHRLSEDSAEFALAIADRLQGHGLGTLLLEALIERARGHGLAQLVGEVLVVNAQMLEVLRDLGLPVTVSMDQGIAEVTIDLHETAAHQRAMATRAAQARESARHESSRAQS
jgi:N-acetylglutamate synthase-like GNAT family acetyltransferase